MLSLTIQHIRTRCYCCAMLKHFISVSSETLDQNANVNKLPCASDKKTKKCFSSPTISSRWVSGMALLVERWKSDVLTVFGSSSHLWRSRTLFRLLDLSDTRVLVFSDRRHNGVKGVLKTAGGVWSAMLWMLKELLFSHHALRNPVSSWRFHMLCFYYNIFWPCDKPF